MMIGIRVDANIKIATGHVTRCLTIAFGLRRAGFECLFITADENSKKMISQSDFQVICLNTTWSDLEEEIEKMVEVIQKNNIEKLIVDTYAVTFKYLDALEAQTKVIYIDDMNFFKYPVAMVINYNIYYNSFLYKETYRDAETKFLLGCCFAPLRDEFIEAKYLFRDKVKKVLITTGGADQYNVAGKLINRIIKDNLFNAIEFHIVVGKLNSNIEILQKVTDGNTSIFLHKDVRNMAQLMRICDIAITSGGTTMYELSACGLPSICFSFADNQLLGVKGFEKEGLMLYAGDIRYDEEKCLTSLLYYLKEYVKDVESRKERSFKMIKKVDGYGTKRIVQAIAKLMKCK